VGLLRHQVRGHALRRRLRPAGRRGRRECAMRIDGALTGRWLWKHRWYNS
jgi:hypothetical protein